MPVRLIIYIVCMVVIAIFLGVNGANSCDINLIFAKFSQVPVITTILISFAAGIFVMLPFTLCRKKKKKDISLAKEPLKKSKRKTAKGKMSFSKNKKKDDFKKADQKKEIKENMPEANL